MHRILHVAALFASVPSTHSTATLDWQTTLSVNASDTLLTTLFQGPSSLVVLRTDGKWSPSLTFTWISTVNGSIIRTRSFAGGHTNATHALAGAQTGASSSGKENFVVTTSDKTPGGSMNPLSLTAFSLSTGSVAWTLAWSESPPPSPWSTMCEIYKGVYSPDPFIIGYSADTGTIILAKHAIGDHSSDDGSGTGNSDSTSTPAPLVVEAMRADKDGKLHALWTWSDAFASQSTVATPTCAISATLVPDASTIAITFRSGAGATASYERVSLAVETGVASCYPTGNTTHVSRWNDSTGYATPVCYASESDGFTQWNGRTYYSSNVAAHRCCTPPPSTYQLYSHCGDTSTPDVAPTHPCLVLLTRAPIWVPEHPLSCFISQTFAHSSTNYSPLSAPSPTTTVLACTQDDEPGSRDSTAWLASADCTTPLAVSDKLRAETGFEPTLTYVNFRGGFVATLTHDVTWWQDSARYVTARADACVGVGVCEGHIDIVRKSTVRLYRRGQFQHCVQNNTSPSPGSVACIPHYQW